MTEHTRCYNSPQDIYARCLVSHRGYPLWIPELKIQLPKDYQDHGLKIGDVGYVVPELGCFEVLFNICLSIDHELHRANGVPRNFQPLTLNETDVATYPDVEDSGCVIATSSVKHVEVSPLERPSDYRFTISSSEGALLILPQGADLHSLQRYRRFGEYAKKHAVEWYRFATEDLERVIAHDSLYLITGFYKAMSWALASFQEAAGSSEFPAQFRVTQVAEGNIIEGYNWSTTPTLHKRVGPKRYNGNANQALYISGFKIAVTEEVFGRKRITVATGMPSTQLPSEHFTVVMDESDEHEDSDESTGSTCPNYRSSTNATGHVSIQRIPTVLQPFHPSDIINQYLLRKVPTATVAITHDSQWITLLEDGLIQPQDLVEDHSLDTILSKEYNVVSEDGVVCLQSDNRACITRDEDGDSHSIAALQNASDKVVTSTLDDPSFETGTRLHSTSSSEQTPSAEGAHFGLHTHKKSIPAQITIPDTDPLHPNVQVRHSALPSSVPLSSAGPLTQSLAKNVEIAPPSPTSESFSLVSGTVQIQSLGPSESRRADHTSDTHTIDDPLLNLKESGSGISTPNSLLGSVVHMEFPKEEESIPQELLPGRNCSDVAATPTRDNLGEEALSNTSSEQSVALKDLPLSRASLDYLLSESYNAPPYYHSKVVSEQTPLYYLPITSPPLPSQTPSSRASSTDAGRVGSRPSPRGPRKPSGITQQPLVPNLIHRTNSVTSAATHDHDSTLSRSAWPKLDAAASQPPPKFQKPAPKWRGMTLEAAKWTFTSHELQSIVSRAIQMSSEGSSIRLLNLETLEGKIADETHRLEMQRIDVKVHYKALVRKRWALMGALVGQVGGNDAATAIQTIEELAEVSLAHDQLAEKLHEITEQLAQLKSLREVHNWSALAMALRKMSRSFDGQVVEKEQLKVQVDNLQSERDEAWKYAESVAQECDELNDRLFEATASDAGDGQSLGNDAAIPFQRNRRSANLSAIRKSNIRLTQPEVGLRFRSKPRHRRSSFSGTRTSISQLAPSAGDIPPVPTLSMNSPTSEALTASLPSSPATSTSFFSSTQVSFDQSALGVAQQEVYEMLGMSLPEVTLRPQTISGPPNVRHGYGARPVSGSDSDSRASRLRHRVCSPSKA